MKRDLSIKIVHIPGEPSNEKAVRLVVISDTHNETEKLQHFVPEGTHILLSVTVTHF
jgi:hypothetical protein